MAKLVIIILFISNLAYHINCLCDSSNVHNFRAGICNELHSSLVDSLFRDSGNIFRMQNAFFYSPTANPILLKIVYNISYSEAIARAIDLDSENNDTSMWNFTANANATNSYSENAWDFAMNDTDSELVSCYPDFENSSISLKTRIIHGWSSVGVYTWFHPGALNLMQFQLPFTMLGLIRRAISHDIDLNGPKANAFLWDGSYELPTLRLDLHISNLTCIPDQEMFDAALMKLTSWVSIHYLAVMISHM